MAGVEYEFSVAKVRADLRQPIPTARTQVIATRSRGRKQQIKKAQLPQESRGPCQVRPWKPLPSRACFERPISSRKAPRSYTPRMLSSLERLPQELLEDVFIRCLNISLPRASQPIGKKLSTTHMYKQFSYRIYCTNIRPERDGPVSLSPPADLKNADERSRITQERRAMHRARSQGLTCRWATYPFFKALHDAVRKSPNLWLGLFSCSMPSKLLRPPPSPSHRDLLLSLASLGTKLNPDSLAYEDTENLWLWAASKRDLYVLQCLMEPRFGFRPTRDQRVAALERSRYDLEVIRVFRETRAQDPKSGWEWPLDWKKEWPLGDPVVEVALCQEYGLEAAKLEDMIASGAHLKDWRVGFGSPMPRTGQVAQDETARGHPKDAG